MRYSKAIVREATGEADPITSPVGWAGTQKRNDTLLWGQSVNLQSAALDAGGAETVNFGVNNAQVIHVHYERPTTWQIKIVIDVTRPPGETASLRVFFPISIGVGQAQVTLTRFHDFVSPAPGGPEQFEVNEPLTPAQSIQVAVGAIFGLTGVVTAGGHSVRVTALCSPVVQ